MAKKKTTEELIKEAKKIVASKNRDKKLLIKGKELIKKAKLTHPEINFSKTKYNGSLKKSVFLCASHGAFEQKIQVFIKGKGCPKCVAINAGKKRRALFNKEFISKSKEAHGNRYDYSKVNLDGSVKKVTIICKKHGSFKQKASAHTLGSGCPKCSTEERADSIKETFNKSFLKRATEAHGNKYDYSKIKLKGSNHIVTIICKKHGKFEQLASSHLRGCGCDKCAKDQASYSTTEFIKKSTKIHGSTYNYQKTTFTRTIEKVTITCEKHGDFIQTASDHLQGNGCPKCAHHVSKAETKIAHFLAKYTPVRTSNKKILKGQELDIVLKKTKVAIEYNGLRWHSTKFRKKEYHNEKTQLTNKSGYRLIHIWEDDYLKNPTKTLQWLKAVLGFGKKEKIGARKCTVEIVSSKEAKTFQNEYHIQGSANGTIHLGLKYQGVLVSIASYIRKGSGVYDLTRFTNKPKFQIIGGYQRLEKAFLNQTPECKTIITFADLSWIDSTNNTYERNGFKKVKTLAPDYKYVVNGKRKHKFGYRHKGMKNKLELYDPNLTEKENMKANNIYRIYDCGKIKYSKEV